MQAEPQEALWALAAAGAAARCSGAPTSSGGVDVGGSSAEPNCTLAEAIRRYEAIVAGAPQCVEALQQLSRLCNALGDVPEC